MLSIIIPALNEEKNLSLLLKEIKKQSFVDYEIIVADAGSKDKTLEIAKTFDCKIVPGGLPAKGRNEGAKIARGDVLLFTDADNIFLPEHFLKDLLNGFEKKKLDVASFPIYPASISDFPPSVRNEIEKNGGGVYPRGNAIDKIVYGLYNFWVNFSQGFSAWATNSVLVKKEIFEKVGGFDEGIKIAEDHDFAKRAARVGKFGFIKTEPVLTSSRRFEKEGRFKTYFKYVLAGIHMFFLGPVKKDIFRYRFDRLKKTEKDI